MRTRHQRDRIALIVVITLTAIALAFTLLALTYEPLRDFLIFCFYVLALLTSG